MIKLPQHKAESKSARKRELAALLLKLSQMAAELDDEPEETAPPPIQRDSYSISEFAAAHGVSRGHVYKLIRSGLPHFKIGAHTRIVPGEALEWLKAHGGEVGSDD